MKAIIKSIIGVGVLCVILAPKILSLNDSYEEEFCKSYNQFIKYSWALNNQYSESWQDLFDNEFSRMQEIVIEGSPSDSNMVTELANHWFSASESGDLYAGSTFGAMLFVECEKNGVDMDESYLPK